MKAQEEVAGRERQEAIRAVLRALPGDRFSDRATFDEVLEAAMKTAGVRTTKSLRTAIHVALGERDETAVICVDASGEPEHDPELRDSEQIPLGEDIDTYFDREVRPYADDAWINHAITDPFDGERGIVGYEINFNRYFYEYTPPRPLEEIKADLKALEREIVEGLAQVTGGDV